MLILYNRICEDTFLQLTFLKYISVRLKENYFQEDLYKVAFMYSTYYWIRSKANYGQHAHELLLMFDMNSHVDTLKLLSCILLRITVSLGCLFKVKNEDSGIFCSGGLNPLMRKVSKCCKIIKVSDHFGTFFIKVLMSFLNWCLLIGKNLKNFHFFYWFFTY